jgi:hypothetical protein
MGRLLPTELCRTLSHKSRFCENARTFLLFNHSFDGIAFD